MGNQKKNDWFYWDDFVREMTDRAWVKKASCLGMDTELFFPSHGPTPERTKKICAGCEVQVECQEYGKSETYGIWCGS